MKPYPLTDKDSIDLLMMGSVKAGFPSPAEEVREKLDLVKLLVQHSASTFFFRIDGISMVDADMDEGDIIIVDRAVEPYNNSRPSASSTGSTPSSGWRSTRAGPS